MKATRRNWMAQEKTAILNLMNQGLKPSQIKKKVFPKNRSISLNALSKVIERIKKNPKWASEEPSIIFNYTKNTNKRKAGLHIWSVKEKQRFFDAVVKGWSIKKIKDTFYKSDKTVTLTSLYSVNHRLKKDPSWITHEPFQGKVNPQPAEKNQIKIVTATTHFVNGKFELDTIHEKFAGYKQSVNTFVDTINALIDENCPFEPAQKQKILDFIKSEGIAAITQNQESLVTNMEFVS